MKYVNTKGMENKVKWELGEYIWFFYFVIMFNFYTYTYVQLLAQLVVIFYTISIFFKRGKILKKDAKSIGKYILWYGLFAIWCALTVKWCVYPPREDTNTLLTLFRILIVGICLVYFIKTKNSVDGIIDVLIKSGAIFAILTIFSNPISAWGKEQYFFSIDGGYMRNGIANFCCLLIFLLLYHRKRISKIQYIFFFILFVGLIMICGSRRSIIILALLIFLYLITIKDISKMMTRIIIFSLIGIMIFMIAINIPYIKSTYFLRIQQMLMGTESTDSSTVGRNAYIIIGWGMFLKRPILGWGVDGFYNYLLHNPYAYAENYYLKALYSHNNYIELLSCFGIIGLILFYQMHFKLLLKNLKNMKSDQNSRFIAIAIILTLISDYGGIAFSVHINMYILMIFFCMNEFNLEKTVEKQKLENLERIKINGKHTDDLL